MMKKNLFWLIVIILTGSLLTMTSCSDDDITPNTENPENNSGNQGNEVKLKNCEKKVYFDDISTEDPFLVTALKQRFPNSVSIDEAEIIFVSKQRYAEIDEEIEDCLLRGGLVVFFDPGLDNGWDIPDYTPVEGVTDIFFAANNYEQYYTMVGEPEDDIVTTEAHAITPEEQAQIDASVAYGMQNPDEDPILANIEKEEYDYPSVEYFNNRLTPFIDWIEEMDAINAEEDENVTKASLPKCPATRTSKSMYETMVWCSSATSQYRTTCLWPAVPQTLPNGISKETAACRYASISILCLCSRPTERRRLLTTTSSSDV